MQLKNSRAKIFSSRRELLRIALGGFTSLTLGDVARLRASPLAAGEEPSANAEQTAIILVWLRGGASHLDTFDPKPMAPSEYRGPFQPIHTNVAGIDISELLPGLSKIADRYALIRSLSHTGGGHPAGSLQMLSGDPDPADKLFPKYPDWMTVTNYFRSISSKSQPALPHYAAINPVDRYDNFTIAGATYAGPAYDAFSVHGDFGAPEFRVPNIAVGDEKQKSQLLSRASLKQSLDGLKRSIDSSSTMDAVDRFDAQALNLLVSPKAAKAFDLSKESPRIRDRYGRHAWGQQCLLARRLVEAGVSVVTTEFDGSLCGRVANWDDHAVNHHVFDALSFRAPVFDQAVSALIEDVYVRGLAKRVMVVVTGEFGRTPRISHVASSGGGVASADAGVVQPGRDHWPQAGSMLFAGGGIRTGQVIGATDQRGEAPIESRVGPEDFLATLYDHLKIDYQHATINDLSGRPTPIIRSGKPIRQLWS